MTDFVAWRARHRSPGSHGSLISNGRFAGVAAVGVVAAVAWATAPAVLSERTQDWTIYQHAAERLAAGQPLYLFQQSAAREAYFLYPPLTAVVWPAVGRPEVLLAIKLVVLLLVGALAWRLPVGHSAERWVCFAALYGAALLTLPDLHDMALGNVMLLYVGSISMVVAIRGWAGAIPLGVVLALAAKPAIVPVLLWLAVRRRDDIARVLVIAVATSLFGLVTAGLERYVEYLQALPAMSALLGLEGGNAGLSAIGPVAATAGLLVGLAATVWSAVRLEPFRGAAVAIAAALLVQPTIGLNYGGVLLPGSVCLWIVDRPAGLAAFVSLPILVVRPPLAGAVLVGLALARPILDRWRARVTQQRTAQ